MYEVVKGSSTFNVANKSMNYSSAFVDMPVATTSGCCEKPDRNSDSQSLLAEKFNKIDVIDLLIFYLDLLGLPQQCSQ
ncbi:hypothetical protein T10_7422 [Trichinella papuae]|uniref:Uncharacterized protein n=1 Tax=Trichinella papuae TaxID=268474 RepID=A0A0V1MHN8_9BILA|nr:hypothetical protein T10_7422 [Trichinella papuae]